MADQRRLALMSVPIPESNWDGTLITTRLGNQHPVFPAPAVFCVRLPLRPSHLLRFKFPAGRERLPFGRNVPISIPSNAMVLLLDW